MVDWGYPTRKDRFLTIDDHVNGYMYSMVDLIAETHGVKKINLMGICMGGVFSIIYSALHPHRVQNLVTTVTPTNFDTDQGLLNVWMRQTDDQILGDVYANMPGEVMNLGFLLLNPARLMIDKYVGFLQNMDNQSYVENFIRMEKWIFDSPDQAGETFRQFIKDFYQQNCLINGTLRIGDRSVDLKAIDIPVLNVYAEQDHLVPPDASKALRELVGTKDYTELCFPGGHIGIYVSGKAQAIVPPAIAEWLDSKS